MNLKEEEEKQKLRSLLFPIKEAKPTKQSIRLRSMVQERLQKEKDEEEALKKKLEERDKRQKQISKVLQAIMKNSNSMPEKIGRAHV